MSKPSELVAITTSCGSKFHTLLECCVKKLFLLTTPSLLSINFIGHLKSNILKEEAILPCQRAGMETSASETAFQSEAFPFLFKTAGVSSNPSQNWRMHRRGSSCCFYPEAPVVNHYYSRQIFRIKTTGPRCRGESHLCLKLNTLNVLAQWYSNWQLGPPCGS